jgi:hypothetical protein
MASLQYEQALRAAQAHHARSKTYSGKLLRPHKRFLCDLIERLQIESALDYGSGKGLQYEWVDPADGKTLAESFGFMPHLFDPAWPPFAAEPAGQFDLVMVTHVLGSIPLKDHHWVMERIMDHATKAIFVGEKVGRIKKTVFGKRDGLPNGWGPDEWIAMLRRHVRPGIELHLSCTIRNDDGSKITERHVL